MTTGELLGLLAARGLSVGWQGETPCLRGPREMATPALLRALAFHRGELLARFPPPAPARRLREWLWNSGYMATEEESWGWADDQHPAGAWWFRFAGQRDWKRTPQGDKWGRGAIPPIFAPADG